MQQQPVVSRAEWLEARKALLAKEKAHTRQGDELARERMALPWVEITKPYLFHGPSGDLTLADLFNGRSQLFVYHFMLGPGWKEGCPGCSFLSDHVDGARQHFEHHDITYVAVSRGTFAEITPFKQRMGWTFPWVSSSDSDFNFDFHVSFTPEQKAAGTAEYNFQPSPVSGDEAPGLSIFYKNPEGRIFHTYSAYARGGEILIGAYAFIDLTPRGRDEGKDGMGNWMRHHDRYETQPPKTNGFIQNAQIKPAAQLEERETIQA
jgi:predicted dithiol-disulfide oxidoreductase (DUF899 family)